MNYIASVSELWGRGSMARSKPKMFLLGIFRLEDAYGARVNISSSKAQGLLALLATTPNGERNRIWLQSMLWSDRGPEQAAGSLRQSLTFLRKALKPAGISLETDRQRIALDLSSVEIVQSGDGDFLEGIDVRDQEFERWLSDERQQRQSIVEAELRPSSGLERQSSGQWKIALVPETERLGLDRWFESLFSDSLSRSLREIFSAPITVGCISKVTDQTILVRVESFLTGKDEMTLRVSLDHPAADRQLWSGHRLIPLKDAPAIDHPDLLRLVNELIEALGDYLIVNDSQYRLTEDPDKLCRVAIRSLFSMDPRRLVEADTHFKRAFDIQERGLYLAWRAQLRAIQSIENHPVDHEMLKEEALYFCERALELEPNNSMVLAALANALRRFDRNDHRSLAMAQRSVQLNPANPMAWWAVSAAKAYAGQHSSSYQTAVVARELVHLSPNRFWWDCQMFVGAMPQGKLDEAITSAEQCSSGNPNFRPPLRYLIALYASAGRTEEALRAVEELKIQEPDFSIDRLMHDDAYPASLIHKTPGLVVDRLSALL